jgi:hypothetical protein
MCYAHLGIALLTMAAPVTDFRGMRMIVKGNLKCRRHQNDYTRITLIVDLDPRWYPTSCGYGSLMLMLNFAVRNLISCDC